MHFKGVRSLFRPMSLGPSFPAELTIRLTWYHSSGSEFSPINFSFITLQSFDFSTQPLLPHLFRKNRWHPVMDRFDPPDQRMDENGKWRIIDLMGFKIRKVYKCYSLHPYIQQV